MLCAPLGLLPPVQRSPPGPLRGAGPPREDDRPQGHTNPTPLPSQVPGGTCDPAGQLSRPAQQPGQGAASEGGPSRANQVHQRVPRAVSAACWRHLPRWPAQAAAAAEDLSNHVGLWL